MTALCLAAWLLYWWVYWVKKKVRADAIKNQKLKKDLI